MTLSTDHSTGVDSTAELLRELGRLQRENRELRRRNRLLEQSRDHWREEARAWKWGALQVERAVKRYG